MWLIRILVVFVPNYGWSGFFWNIFLLKSVHIKAKPKYNAKLQQNPMMQYVKNVHNPNFFFVITKIPFIVIYIKIQPAEIKGFIFTAILSLIMSFKSLPGKGSSVTSSNRRIVSPSPHG